MSQTYFRLGELVDVLVEGKWTIGVVQTMTLRGFCVHKYGVCLLNTGRVVTAVDGNMRRSTDSKPDQAPHSHCPQVPHCPQGLDQPRVLKDIKVETNQQPWYNGDSLSVSQEPWKGEDDFENNVETTPPSIHCKQQPWDDEDAVSVSQDAEEPWEDEDGSADANPIQTRKPRFERMAPEDLDKLQTNGNTKSARTDQQTSWGIGVLRKWLSENELQTDFENLTEDVLADTLRRFYGEARNKRSEQYSRSSLTCLRACIQRHLAAPPNNLKINIISGGMFKTANDVIFGQTRNPEMQGLDKYSEHKPNSNPNVQKVYNSGVLSECLLNTGRVKQDMRKPEEFCHQLTHRMDQPMHEDNIETTPPSVHCTQPPWDEEDNVSVSQEPWEDADDLVDPNSMQTPRPRFEKMAPEDLDKLQTNGQTNGNSRSARTRQQTSWGIGVLREWLIENELQTDFENLPEDILADTLRRFYGEARNKKSEQYSRSSLMCLRACIQRHLAGPPHNLKIDIISGGMFKAANDVIFGKIRILKMQGIDRTSGHKPTITASDMQKMYNSGVLSGCDPTSLQSKVFFEISYHLGRMGRHGFRDLKKDNIVFKTDASGKEYATLCFNNLDKNQKRENEHDQRMYATGDARCPIRSLKFYLSRLNPESDAFLQRPMTSKFLGGNIWYWKNPLGVNTISDFMPRISERAQLSYRYTNHCIRATTATSLRDRHWP